MTHTTRRASLLLAATLAALSACSEPLPPEPTTPAAKAAKPWVEKLRTGNPAERDQAVKELAKIDDPVVFQPLLDAARFDTQPQIRVFALRALARPPVVKDNKPLIALLSDPVDEIRLAACEVLGRLKATDAEDALAGCVSDQATFVRLAAVKALSDLGPQALSRLQKMFDSGSVEERVAVADVYGRSGDPAHVPDLIKALSAPEDQLRRTAVDALGRLKDERAVEPLVALIRSPLSDAKIKEYDARFAKGPAKYDLDSITHLLDEDVIRSGRRPTPGMHNWVYKPGAAGPMFRRLLERQKAEAALLVRRTAVDALRQINTPKATAAVVAIMAFPEADVADAAIKSLGSSDTSTSLLYTVVQDASQPPLARTRALQLLLRETQEANAPKADQQLLAILKASDHADTPATDEGDPDAPPEKSPATAPVAPLDPRLEDVLIGGLKDKDPLFRAQCAKTLAARRADKAIEPLIALLGADDPAVRSAAVEGLANFTDPRPVPKLLAILKDPKAGDFRRQTIATLAAIRDKQAVPALLEIAAADGPLQVDAIRALGRIGDPSAGKRLLEIYQALDKALGAMPPGRGLAKHALIQAFGQVRATAAVPVLVANVKDATKKGGGDLHESMTALGLIGDKAAVEPIIARLKSGPYQFKSDKHINYTTKAGIEALERLNDPRVVPLLESFARTPPDEPTLGYAYHALGRLKCRESADVLVRFLADPKIDAGVKDTEVGPALTQLGIVAKDPLLKLLTDTPALADKTDGPTFDPGIYAAQILAVMGKDALPELKKLAQPSTPRHVLARVVEALQRIDEDDAAAALGGLLQSPEPLVRQWTVVALGKSKCDAAVPLLKAAAADSDAQVAKWAKWGLDKHGVKQ